MKNDIVYKSIHVWSAGENGKTKKIEMLCGYVVSILYLALLISIFVCSDQKTIGARIAETLCVGCFGFLFGLMGPATVKLSLDAIRRNKYIELRLYDMENFTQLGGIPDDMIVVFADSCGAVLCNEKHKAQYRDWTGYSNKFHYHNFEEYYEKHCLPKQNLSAQSV